MRTMYLVTLAVTLAALGWTPAARADLCAKCRDLLFVESEGKCTSCGKAITSGALQLCPQCSFDKKKCERCLTAIDVKEPPPPDPAPDRQDPPAGETPGKGQSAEPGPLDPPPPKLLPPEKSAAEPGVGEPASSDPVPLEQLPEAKPKETSPVAPPARPKPEPIDPSKPASYTEGKWQYRLEITDPGTRSEGKWGGLWYDGQKLARGEINDYYQTPWGPLYWVDVPKTRWGLHGWMPAASPQSNRKGRMLNAPATAEAASPQNPQSKSQWFELGRSENGKRARVGVGQYILVRLPGNPTTGYSWQMASPSNTAVRLLAQPQYVPQAQADKTREKTVGAGGTYYFKFQAVQPGTAVIRLAYARSWERNKPPAETFTVTIDVLAPSRGPGPPASPASTRGPAPRK